MSNIHAVLAAILPVFFVASAGFAIRRIEPLDPRTLSTLNIYLFVPTLVFSSISQHELDWELFARVAMAGLITVLAMRLILGSLARWRGMEGPRKGAFLLTMFMNLGNFGLPVCKFAFGDDGLAIAVVVMVCGSVLQNSIGVYFAQRSHHSAGRAFLRVFRYPLVYALALGLLRQRLGFTLPLAFDRAVEILADAAIPVQLVILGAQVAQTHLDLSLDVWLAAAVRLAVAPLLAVGIASLVGLEGLAAKTFIVQMSGPVAVGMAAYGVQFNVEPRYLASTVSITFLLSLISVSTVLFFVL